MRKSYGAKLFNKARDMARLLGREDHLTVVGRFAELIKIHGEDKVRELTNKVAGYSHNNPLRDIEYIGEWLKNKRQNL